MDSLDTAVVDLTLLIATCRALRSIDAGDAPPDPAPRRPKRLRRQVAAGAASYLRRLARAQDGSFGARQLQACRIAAEARMPDAIEQQDVLAALLRGRDDALGHSTTVRHDLWRLAHLATRLRHLVGGPKSVDDDDRTRHIRKPARRLQRRLRRAMTAYARAAMRAQGSAAHAVRAARHSALLELGDRCTHDAAALVVPSAAAGVAAAIESAVVRPLHHLTQDWEAQPH